jgi:hypothetical protein
MYEMVAYRRNDEDYGEAFTVEGYLNDGETLRSPETGDEIEQAYTRWLITQIRHSTSPFPLSPNVYIQYYENKPPAYEPIWRVDGFLRTLSPDNVRLLRELASYMGEALGYKRVSFTTGKETIILVAEMKQPVFAFVS